MPSNGGCEIGLAVGVKDGVEEWMVPCELRGTYEVKGAVGDIFKEKRESIRTTINVYVPLVIIILDKGAKFWLWHAWIKYYCRGVAFDPGGQAVVLVPKNI